MFYYNGKPNYEFIIDSPCLTYTKERLKDSPYADIQVVDTLIPFFPQTLLMDLWILEGCISGRWFMASLLMDEGLLSMVMKCSAQCSKIWSLAMIKYSREMCPNSKVKWLGHVQLWEHDRSFSDCVCLYTPESSLPSGRARCPILSYISYSFSCTICLILLKASFLAVDCVSLCVL